ncbi:hypothetical protein [Nostoc sp. FACHB-110]|uniref:hypothetical protein n=1 Tax=Nostoc sp. FACHB-110 TaxID=2692834 RepID=UPI001689B8C7|nr:hypothetical protein [Nostoc sp. FACHB-110]MBD2439715.1 hypothetical protein [Nostoc sp. FACHB-110]
MKTISALFSEERQQLQTEIDHSISVEQVVKLVQSRLDNLERAYISELNLTQVRLAAFILDMLRQSIATLAAANQSSVTSQQQKPISDLDLAKFSPNRLILKSLKALIYVGILGSLFSLTKINASAWMAILLTSLLIGLEIVLQLDKNHPATELLELPQPVLRVDSKILLDNLADALHTIDLAVARFAEGNQAEDDRTIEELPELLNFLQRLMGASYLDQPQMAIALAKMLPQILMSQGIQAQIYQPQAALSGREYFDFEPSIDPDTQDYVTITPALIKGDRLLRRGRVIEPAYSQARES